MHKGDSFKKMPDRKSSNERVADGGGGPIH